MSHFLFGKKIIWEGITRSVNNSVVNNLLSNKNGDAMKKPYFIEVIKVC